MLLAMSLLTRVVVAPIRGRRIKVRPPAASRSRDVPASLRRESRGSYQPAGRMLQLTPACEFGWIQYIFHRECQIPPRTARSGR